MVTGANEEFPICPVVAPGDLSRYAPANRRRLSGPGMRTFMRIADAWNLTEEERRLALGCPSRSSYHGWCRKAHQHEAITLSVDRLTRISAVLGIQQALEVLFPDPKAAKAWLTSSSAAPTFGGNRPLDLVTGGTLDGLLRLRRFLDGACMGVYMRPNDVDEGFKPYTDEEIVIR